MKEREIIYEPHPVSLERKADLVARGYKIIDARFAPSDYKQPEFIDDEDSDSGSEKAELVARAHELKLGSPSTLMRWSIERLQQEIEKASTGSQE